MLFWRWLGSSFRQKSFMRGETPTRNPAMAAASRFGLDAEQQAGAADDEGNPCCRHGKFRSGYTFGLRIGSHLPTLHQVMDAAIREESAEETDGQSGTELCSSLKLVIRFV